MNVRLLGGIAFLLILAGLAMARSIALGNRGRKMA
jgi:hypothetical protein